ncbi:MAG: carboxypeptidase-like regulatory domain-containing protein [Bacteroidales bacterium]|nr:carboxypeptidase-like regulatory domain-containing protein [Bacteroidales bacterium]
MIATAICLAVTTMLMSCDTVPEPDPDDPDNPNPVITMVDVKLEGIIKDIDGSPLNGVKVTTGTKSITSGADGTFSFTQANVVNDRVIVKLEKSGYFTLTRSGVKADDMYIEAVLTPKGNTGNSLQTTFEAANGTTLQVAGAKVVIAPNGIMKKDGSAYSGTVKVDMRYLDPYAKNFHLMMAGGNHAGINKAGEEVILLSFGIIGVELADNQNNPLQLKSGVPADVTLSVPAEMSGATLPTTVPVSSFDEQKGIWVEEGVATLQGGVYVGKVTHFSDIDLAPLELTKLIEGRVIDCNRNPVPRASIWVESSDNIYGGEGLLPLGWLLKTSSDGEWSLWLPKDRVVSKIAAWVNFEKDDEYTEKYTMEGVEYISQLCGGEGGYFMAGIAKFWLDYAVVHSMAGMSILTFYGKDFSVRVHGLSIGNTLPEGNFPIEAWQVLYANGDSYSGGGDMDAPATMDIKKLNNDRYEFNTSGKMLYFNYNTMQGREEDCSLYYKSGEYKGVNRGF